VVLGPKQKDDQEKRDVVQPDLVIVCDEKKVTPRAIEGTPDMVIEIVSPTSIKRDFNDKFLLFEQFQVPVYWIVVLEQQLVYVFEWDQKSKSLRETGQYGPQDSAPVSIIQGGKMDLSEIFTD
jgi:Uma2 family endonuclease